MGSHGDSQREKPGRKQSDSVDWEVVRSHELEQIERRRREAFKDLHGSNPDPRPAGENLVGLALSGGGLRSAAFSLGVIQALHKRCVLPCVDYLSTVSGGGYAGAYLSSLALTRKSGRQSGDEDAAGQECEPFPIASKSSSQATRRMHRFINSGNYLNDWRRFLNRYLMGLMLIWLVVLSGLVAFASLTAYVFRSLDHQLARDWLTALGFRGDVSLAFFPAFIFLLFWLAAWSISYLRKKERALGQVARWFLYAVLFSAATAIAMLLMNGDIATASPSGRENTSMMDRVASWIWVVVVSGIGVSLLPYLQPKRLFQSGANPQNATEKYLFWIATRALVFGVPFLMIAFFARENISGWEQERDARLASTDFAAGGKARFEDRIRYEGQKGQLTPAAYLWQGRMNQGSDNSQGTQELEQELFREMIQSGLAKVAATIDGEHLEDLTLEALDDRSLSNRDHSLAFFERWCALTGLIIEWNLDTEQKNPLVEYTHASQASRAAHRKFLFLINMRLLNSDFYKLFNRKHLEPLYPDRGQKFWADVALAQAKAQERIEALPPLDNLSRMLTTLEGIQQASKPNPGTDSEENSGEDRDDRAQPSDIDLLVAFLSQFVGKDSDVQSQRMAWQLYPAALLKHRELEQRVVDFPEPQHPQLFIPAELQQQIFEDEEQKSETWLALEQRQKDILMTNRSLLETLYPEYFPEDSKTFSYVVLIKDQEERWWWFKWSAALFLVSALIVDLNATSWHGFYAERIADMWIDPVPGFGREIPLAQLETVDVGKPYHLINGTLQLLGRSLGDREKLPKREVFLFSQLYCGADRVGYADTGDWMNSSVRLSDAVAVSGGAVSPLTGSNPLITVLLTLANVRLGQWFANPNYEPRNDLARFWWCNYAVTPLRIISRLWQPSEERPYLFISDGGHQENLGVESLLRRRCRLIIASDAGMDGGYLFSDFSRLIRIARNNHGIELQRLDGGDGPISLADLIPAKQPGDADSRWNTEFSKSHFVIFRINYPDRPGEDSTPGYLVYMKSTLTGDESPDLLSFRNRNPDFPHDSTADQFYDSDRFDSYRQLGEEIGLSVCKALGANGENFRDTEQFIDRFLKLYDPESAGNPDGKSEQQTQRAESLQEGETPNDEDTEFEVNLNILNNSDDSSGKREDAAKHLAASWSKDHPERSKQIAIALFDAANLSDYHLSRLAEYLLTSDAYQLWPVDQLIGYMEEKIAVSRRVKAGELLEMIFRAAAAERDVAALVPKDLVSRLVKLAEDTSLDPKIRFQAIHTLSQFETSSGTKLSDRDRKLISQMYRDLEVSRPRSRIEKAIREAKARSEHASS